MERATSLAADFPLLRSGFIAHLLSLFLWVTLLGMCSFASAQTKEIYLSPTTNSQIKPMTVNDVIKLSKAGLSDDLIIQQIKKKGQRFDLSTDQLIQLKAASVSERVIQVMIDPTPNRVPAPAPKMVATIAQPALQANQPPDPVSSTLPTEIGVYAKQKGKWVEVLPEVVNWKTGGVVKSHASLGVVKGDINGHINQAVSSNKVTLPVDFLIVVPEGEAISEYQLLRLRQHSGDREFRTVTGGVFHVSGGATRDLMPFDSKKMLSRTYQVTLPVGLGIGEYGFLPPGAYASMNVASRGKIYSFRVIE